MSRKRLSLLVASGLLLLGVGCGIAVQRDLSAIPPGQVGFDDMCGLQEYFDALEIKTSPPPRVVSALDLEGQSGGKPMRGGKERFAFDDDFQLKHLRRVLNENWRRLPEPIASGHRDRDRGPVVREGRHQAGGDRPAIRNRRRRPELAASLPALYLGAALRRAALPPAARDVGIAASG